jgi:hypothetical protein
MEEGVVMAGPSGAAPYPGIPPNPTYVTDEEWRSKRGGREPRAQVIRHISEICMGVHGVHAWDRSRVHLPSPTSMQGGGHSHLDPSPA